MNFGKKTTIESKEISKTLADSIYGEGNKDPHRKLLYDLCSIFEQDHGFEREFTCLIEQRAMDAFVSFANEVYKKTRNEATGVIVGYYLHDPDFPNKKVIVGTNFLQATGSASSVTCEFSYEDSIRHSAYCDEHHLLPVIWIHSHPGFGVFYSGTDSSTLKHYFACNHQVGVVVDNLNNKYMGFKMYNGVQQVEDIYSFSIEECLKEKKLIYSKLNDAQDVAKKKGPVSYKQLSEVSQQHPPVSKESSPISYQILQKLSSQLAAIENDNSVDKLRKCVEDLAVFIQELKRVSIEKVENESKYTADDIKKELTIQINNIVQDINNIFCSIKNEFASFGKLSEQMESLHSEVVSIKKAVEPKKEPVDASLLNKTLVENNAFMVKSRVIAFIKSFNARFNIRELMAYIAIIVLLSVLIFS